MKYTKIDSDAFRHLQLNAGILVTAFTPADGTIGDIIGATGGGITFTAEPVYADLGEDIDNCPPNTRQLKVVTSYDAALSGSFKSVDSAALAGLAGNAVSSAAGGLTTVTPKDGFVTDGWYDELWWVGDYTDTNTDSTTARAGFIAIRLKNALNTGGFQIKSTDQETGEFAFDYHAHYSLSDPDTVPFEIYIFDQFATGG